MKRVTLLITSLASLAFIGCVKFDEATAPAKTQTLIREGVSYQDATKLAALELALKGSGVPYTVEQRENQTHITWDAKYSNEAQLIQEKLFGPPLPSGRNLSSNPELQERFKAWLTKNNIPYRLQHSEGREFVIWEEEFTPMVQKWEFFPPSAASRQSKERRD